MEGHAGFVHVMGSLSKRNGHDRMRADLGAGVEATSPCVPPTQSGGLQGEVWLTLQSHQAQSLIRGRRGEHGKPAIVGLLGFADRLRTLWQAASLDDPYADWWLLKVESGIAEARAQMRQLQQDLDALMTTPSGLEFSVACAERPQRVSLHFLNPYAFRGAQLLADYDRVVCTALTLRHVGVVLPTAVSDQLAGSGRWVRRVLALPHGYHQLDVSRRSLAMGGANAEQARERMGEVPQDVFCRERVPSLRPALIRAVPNVDPSEPDESCP